MYQNVQAFISLQKKSKKQKKNIELIYEKLA